MLISKIIFLIYIYIFFNIFKIIITLKNNYNHSPSIFYSLRVVWRFLDIKDIWENKGPKGP